MVVRVGSTSRECSSPPRLPSGGRTPGDAARVIARPRGVIGLIGRDQAPRRGSGLSKKYSTSAPTHASKPASAACSSTALRWCAGANGHGLPATKRSQCTRARPGLTNGMGVNDARIRDRDQVWIFRSLTHGTYRIARETGTVHAQLAPPPRPEPISRMACRAVDKQRENKTWCRIPCKDLRGPQTQGTAAPLSFNVDHLGFIIGNLLRQRPSRCFGESLERCDPDSHSGCAATLDNAEHEGRFGLATKCSTVLGRQRGAFHPSALSPEITP